MSSREELEVRAQELVTEVRTWCREQAPLWRQVPYLALAAEGIGGDDDRLKACYARGWWRIAHKFPASDTLRCSVDCATGELTSEFISTAQGKLALARDEDILALLTRMADLDAALIIEELKALAVTQSELSAAKGSGVQWPPSELAAQFGLAEGHPYVRPPWQAMAPSNGS
jgi:hypothetical protein